MLSQPLLKLKLHISNEYSARKMILPLNEFAALFLEPRRCMFQIMMSTQSFQFFSPKTLESFSALLLLSQTSSNIFSQFCQSLLLLTTSSTRTLCPLFPQLCSWFPASILGFHCLVSIQDRVIPIKFKLDHAIPLLETSKYPCNLAPVKTRVLRMACQTLDFLTLLLSPLFTQPWPCCSSVCILLLKVFARAVPSAWEAIPQIPI